ncbi:basic juvenile hormone-suppressible protein 2 [Drosophila tropicalis]|uniref:basic juvenile hormone-suppressible protein 2 n=1 Tax=Drosophila tropicalis TaxID=46794 RepID=UPI0035AB6C28
MDLATMEWQIRQRFLLDLLLQVHKPLLQGQLFELGSQLKEEPSDYQEGTWPLLSDFMAMVHQQEMPRPFSIFSQLDAKVPQQLSGVFRFLVFARDWTTFKHNACYARIHFHPVLFVNALQLAVREREDCRMMRLPAPYEVLPQLYFEKDIILAAQLTNWQELAPVKITSRRTWKEILASFMGYTQSTLKDLESELLPAEPIVIEAKKELSHLGLDVELNAYWNVIINQLLMDQQDETNEDNTIIDGDRMMAFRGPSDEQLYKDKIYRQKQTESSQNFIYNLQQIVRLLEWEDLVTGQQSMDIIQPRLITTGGKPYRATNISLAQIRSLMQLELENLKKLIENEINVSTDTPLLTANRIIAENYRQLCENMSRAMNDNRLDQPNMFSMGTSNLRDPIYRSLLYQLDQLINAYTKPFSKGFNLNLKINHLNVSRLETFEEIFNTDLINLMDQQLLQTQRNNLQMLQRRLIASQRRLNHRSFSISYEIQLLSTAAATTTMPILIRFYLIQADDHQAKVGYKLASFAGHITKGLNQFVHHFPSAPIPVTLSELYEAKQPPEISKSVPLTRFPSHLLLPRGGSGNKGEGLKFHLHVVISPWQQPHQFMASAIKEVFIEHRDDRH